MTPEQQKQQEAVKERLRTIGQSILVLSGKGGVGKSTVAVNLAVALAEKGASVGLLDVDIHGPSIPGMCGLAGREVIARGESMIPVAFNENLSVMSVGFLLGGSDDAVIWRGPMKYSVIRQFISEVEWGKLDYLVIDSPPGTGDEPLTVAQLITGNAGAVVVTTPQRVSIDDVRRSITFCRKLNLAVHGIIENMSGFVCPNCGETIDIFDSGGGEALCREMGVPFLGRLPIDRTIVDSCDTGLPFMLAENESPVKSAFREIAKRLITGEEQAAGKQKEIEKELTFMKLAIPLVDNKLSMHFGHCEQFAFIEFDENGTMGKRENLAPPAHEPGVLPAWLHEQGATHIIAGGMGSRAQGLFTEKGITFVVGAPVDSPESIAKAYVEGTLTSGDNVCDH